VAACLCWQNWYVNVLKIPQICLTRMRFLNGTLNGTLLVCESKWKSQVVNVYDHVIVKLWGRTFP
jgi:hypothetical protein